MSYKQLIAIGTATTTAGDTVVVGPLNIEQFDCFSIMYQNDNSLITVVSALVQVAIKANDLAIDSASDVAPDWVTVGTAVIPYPGTLGASATFMTSAVKNSWRWMRILVGTCSTGAAGKFHVAIGGHSRQ